MWLDNNKDLGVLLLRLFIGFRVIYGVLDNILHWPQMLEFRNFLQQFSLSNAAGECRGIGLRAIYSRRTRVAGLY